MASSDEPPVAVATIQKKVKDDVQKLKAINELYRSAETTLNQHLEDLNREIQRLTSENDKYKERLKQLQLQIKSKEYEIKEIQECHRIFANDFEERHMSLERQIAELTESNKTLSAEREEAEKQKSHKEDIIRQLEADIRHLQDKMTWFDMQIDHYKENLMESQIKITSLEKEKLDLTLSDEYRPTKLAEEFSELFDNEWTDAFEALNIENEWEKIQLMLGILKKADVLCHYSTKDQREAVRKGFTVLNVRNDFEELVAQPMKETSAVAKKGTLVTCYKSFQGDFDILTEEQKKTVAYIRRYFADQLLDLFNKESTKIITKNLPETMQTEESLQTYIQKCLQLCWSMCRHEPPVFIHFIDLRSDTLFDTNVYKPYTKTGKYVDYVVWPALYLYENGPMLSKGVAQGRK